MTTYRLLWGMICTCVFTLHFTPANAASCPPEFSNDSQCSANDLQASVVGVTGPSACTEGTLMDIVLTLKIGQSAAVRDATQRYDIGMFGAKFGDDLYGGESCSFRSLSPVEPPLDLTGGNGPFLDLDGDACGDNLKESPTIVDFAMTDVLCEDSDGDGQAEIDFSISWRNNQNDVCSNPDDELFFIPQQTTRCVLELDFEIDVDVEPPIAGELFKVVSPTVLQPPLDRVRYWVSVHNSSSISDPVQLVSLEDDIYGDLNGQGTCSIPQTMAPGSWYFCQFEQEVIGLPGDSETDTITAELHDSEGDILLIDDSATVIFDEVIPELPAMEISLKAHPDALPEPGGTTVYSVIIHNTSKKDIQVNTLTDSEIGNLDGRGNCRLPQELPALVGFYLCEYPRTLEGVPGQIFSNIVTATGAGNAFPVTAQDEESVIIFDVPSTIDVRKQATPRTVREPGANVDINVNIQNTSRVDTVTISTIRDNLQGDLHGVGTCAVGTELAPSEIYECRFTEPVFGNAGDEVDDTVIVTAVDDDSSITGDFDATYVLIVDSVSSIDVTKTANPPALSAPGGDVTFSVTIKNSSNSDEVTIETLVDDIYGDLNGVGTCSVPQVLAPGAGYFCNFTQLITGSNGDVFVDVVTASGTDDDGVPVNDSDEASVEILPGLVRVEVLKNADPTSLPEPGGDVTYTISVANTGTIDFTLTSLVDDIYGDLNGQGDCSVPQVIPVATEASIYTCSFMAPVSGDAGEVITDIVTATVDAGVDGSDVDSDSASVTIEDVPAALSLEKTANPPQLPAPGGPVQFLIKISNTSGADTVTLNTLVDDVYGDLNGQGTCSVPQVLAPQQEYNCSFSQDIQGSNGDMHTDTVFFTATDDDENDLAGSDSATVEIVPGTVTLSLTKTAQPANIAEPGGTITFTVQVRNTGDIELELQSLVDNVHGDLNGQGDCSVPQVLAPQVGSYACSFQADVNGDVGYSETDTVTAFADAGIDGSASAMDSATVTIDDVPASLSASKTPSPSEINAPGGNISYAVTVTNTSAEDSVTIDSLVDDRFGNLAGQGDCAPGAVLAPGQVYGCTFTGSVSGNNGDQHVNTITVSGTDDDGLPVQVMTSAVVDIIQGDLRLMANKVAVPSITPEGTKTITYIVELHNEGALALTVDSLFDDLYGDLNGQGNCTIGQEIAPGGIWRCAFQQEVSGNAGDQVTDEIIATANAGINGDTQATANATVTFEDVPSSINVFKTASPSSLPAPGGTVTFGLNVTNTSQVDTVTIDSITDNIYGDLNGQGDCASGVVLAPQASYSCSFTQDINGNNTDVFVDIITVQGTDDDGNPVQGQDDATVTLEAPQLVLEILNQVTPLEGPEPSADALYLVLIRNSSLVDMQLDSLTDDTWGDLNGQGSCATGGLIEAGALYSCSHPQTLNGNAGDTVLSETTAGGDAGVNGSTNASAETTFTFTDVPSSLALVKNASPSTLPAPGGDVTFTVQLLNTSEADELTVNTLVDEDYGNLHGQGDCSLPQVLPVGATYSCSFVQPVSGSWGDLITSETAAAGVDDDSDAVNAADSTTVEITQGVLSLSLIKTANPENVPEPGGDVTYTVQVGNTGLIDMQLTSLVDDVVGDLNGMGTCSVPQDLPAETSPAYECTFTASVSGNAGDTITNIITALGDAGQDGDTSTTAFATVTIDDLPSSLTLNKRAVPSTIPAPGGDVEFTVLLTNDSEADSVTVNSLMDDVYGDLNGAGSCSVPQQLAPGASYNCSFTESINGQKGDLFTDTITAMAIDDDDNPLNAGDMATVEITQGVVAIDVIKTAIPQKIPEPGGTVTFGVIVRNTGDIPVDITSIVDDVHGDLDGQGTCALPQIGTITREIQYLCTFTAEITGNAGDSETDTVTVMADAGVDGSAQDSDSATVTIEDVPSSITLEKYADPEALEAPGGPVIFTVRVSNGSEADEVTLESLVDNQFGDLNGKGDCAVPQVLQPAAQYECSFVEEITGSKGDEHTNIATVTATDDDELGLEASDGATVTLTQGELSLLIAYSPDPATVNEPGGDVTYTLALSNTSLFELEITALSTDLYGDLNGKGDCSLPQTLSAEGGTYNCTHTEEVNGVPGDEIIAIATASADAGADGTIMVSDPATVVIADVGPVLNVLLRANPGFVEEPGEPVEFEVDVTNASHTDEITIESLVEDRAGDLNGQGDCSLPQSLAIGETYSCVYTHRVEGLAGDDVVHRAVASGTDDDDSPVEGSDRAIVKVQAAQLSLEVFKSADKNIVPGPGALVEYDIQVFNTSPRKDLQLFSLVDDQFGNLDRRGSCRLPYVIGSGDQYLCRFTASVDGEPLTPHINVVTATATPDTEFGPGPVQGQPEPTSGRDSNQREVSGRDSAFVLILDEDLFAPIPTLSKQLLALLGVLFLLLGLLRIRGQ